MIAAAGNAKSVIFQPRKHAASNNINPANPGLKLSKNLPTTGMFNGALVVRQHRVY